MITVWGHDGCPSIYKIKLTSCPRHPGTQMREVTMPKITRYGGPTNFGLNQADAEFVEPVLTPPEEWVPATDVVPDPEPGLDPEPDPEDVWAPFDPTPLSVKDVLAKRVECTQAEWDEVLNVERAGKARPSILSS